MPSKSRLTCTQNALAAVLWGGECSGLLLAWLVACWQPCSGRGREREEKDRESTYPAHYLRYTLSGHPPPCAGQVMALRREFVAGQSTSLGPRPLERALIVERAVDPLHPNSLSRRGLAIDITHPLPHHLFYPTLPPRACRVCRFACVSVCLSICVGARGCDSEGGLSNRTAVPLKPSPSTHHHLRNCTSGPEGPQPTEPSQLLRPAAEHM